MTRLVIEQGMLAPSLVALAHGGKPAVAASVRAYNQCGEERRGHDLGEIRRSWRPTGDQGHRPLFAGTSYGVPARRPSDLALG